MKKIVVDTKRYLWKISSSDKYSKELLRSLTVCLGTRIIFHRRIRLAAILNAELNAWDKCLAISDVLRKLKDFSPLEWNSIFGAHFLVSNSRDLRNFYRWIRLKTFVVPGPCFINLKKIAHFFVQFDEQFLSRSIWICRGLPKWQNLVSTKALTIVVPSWSGWATVLVHF